MVDWKSDPLLVYVMYPQNRHLSAKVRVFVDWVTEICARQGWRHWPNVTEPLKVALKATPEKLSIEPAKLSSSARLSRAVNGD